MLDVFGVMGIMFYFFLIGVQIDPWVVKTTGRKAFIIGISTAVVAYLLPAIGVFFVPELVKMVETPSILITVGNLTMAGTTFTFPTIARYLYELNILSSKFGRMALSSSIIGTLFNYFYQATLRFRSVEKKGPAILRMAANVTFVVVVIYVIQPVVLWALRWRREGVSLNLGRLYTIFVAVLVTGILSHAINRDVIFGPFILGIALPPGPPLGSALVDKLEFITSWIFMPLYFLKFGLGINVFATIVNSVDNWAWSVIGIGSIGKFLGAFISSILCRIPVRDAIALGLVMNVQGVVELGLFKALKRSRHLLPAVYVMMCTTLLVVTWTVTIILRALYKSSSSKWYQVSNRRTILDTKPNTELRILACIHKEHSVPLIIDVIEASNHSISNPIGLYVLHLEELVGRSDPILISHGVRGSRIPVFSVSRTFNNINAPVLSEHIVNVFQRYEQENNNVGSISVQSFTAISPYSSMHDDVCTLALEKSTSLIIIPFHKLRSCAYDPLESSSSSGTGIRTMNINVLDNSPCSVAILIEGGLWSSSKVKLGNWTSCRVLVLFLGGADDREALAYGARMCGHPNINLTVVRLVANSPTNIGTSKERKYDEYAVNEFKHNMVVNKQIRYIEEMVMDGSNTISVIRSIESDYQLIVVGRRHDERLPVISGLTEWIEHNELGTIGDILASSEFGDASIFVVQTQSNEEEVLQGSSDYQDPFIQTVCSRLDDDVEDPRKEFKTGRG
ncbi:cation/H(+) antiporter 15-like isoform X2 [Macadamia integrifolia]|nr:cation/H(+) antiporter 15-like isoform X2 [Macadamia integrifolia]